MAEGYHTSFYEEPGRHAAGLAPSGTNPGGALGVGSRRMSLAHVMTQRRRMSSMSGTIDPAAIAAALKAHRETSMEKKIQDESTESLPIDDGQATRRPGRYDALTVLRTVQATETRNRRTSDMSEGMGGSKAWDSRSNSVFRHSVHAPAGDSGFRGTFPPPSIVADGSTSSRRQTTSLWGGDEARELDKFKQSQQNHLTLDSSIDDIKNYGRTVMHPGKVLNVLPDEYDHDVYTEFDELCNEMLSVMGDFESALEEMTIWKDDFLRQTVPSNIKLQLTLLFARLFRSKSDLHEPVFELIKQVRIYSRPWLDKRYALVELEKDYQRQCHLIDVAIRKMEQMQLQVARVRTEKRVALWERVTKRLMDMFPDVGGQFEDTEFDGEPGKPKTAETTDSRLSFMQGNEGDSSTRSGTGENSSQVLHRRRPTRLSSRGYSAGHLKSHLLEYVTEQDPTWRRKAKSLVQRFQVLLDRHHPNLVNALGQLHRQPHRRAPQAIYLSMQTGNIIPRTKRALEGLRRSWSMVDLARAAEEEKGGVAAGRNHISGATSGQLRRSNSFAAIHHFGWNARLRRPVPHVPFGQRAPRGKRRERSEHRRRRESRDHPQGKTVNHESHSQPLSGAEGVGRHGSIWGDSDDSSTTDESDFGELGYMEDIDEEGMQELINNFIDQHPMESSEAGKLAGQAIISMDSNEKGTYSLQEVMELTLLHAQQMHLLQSEYEERINHLQTHIADSEAAHDEICSEYERRIETLQERTKRIAQEYVKQVNSVPSKPSTAQDLNASLELDLLSSRNSGRLGTGSSRSRKSSRKRSRQTWRDRTVKPRSPIHLSQKRTLPPWRRPIYTSPPFVMSFMERLRWFTDYKLQKRTHIQEKFQKMEMEANEARLAQRHLLHPAAAAAADSGTGREGLQQLGSGPSTGVDSAHLPAEFMPMPGDVMPPKRRDIWAEHGINMPWGGRFTVQRSHGASMNILNLFDVAMRIQPQPRTARAERTAAVALPTEARLSKTQNVTVSEGASSLQSPAPSPPYHEIPRATPLVFDSPPPPDDYEDF
ncbi:hypothetical protein DFS34DRAFT_609210 [Phlyctochytrium arcticum]|nr:hypothetical protein DFS34DRAFT_609210 [Phlyctochytrium arcticum]